MVIEKLGDNFNFLKLNFVGELAISEKAESVTQIETF